MQLELQTRPAAPWGFRFWQTFIQAFTSQLTAKAGDGANAAARPNTKIVRSNASDKSRDIDTSRF
jgi:hypothetical protein